MNAAAVPLNKYYSRRDLWVKPKGGGKGHERGGERVVGIINVLKGGNNAC